MPDDTIRTRIAAAIMRRWEYEPSCTCQDCSLEVADAVIRELQMTEEVADSSQFHCTKRRARRYVTAWCAEWSTDE